MGIVLLAAALLASENVEKKSAYFSFPPAAGVMPHQRAPGGRPAFFLRQERGCIAMSWNLPGASDGKILLFTSIGRVVASFAVSKPSAVLTWRPVAQFPAHGLYFARLSAGGIVRQERIIIK
jgi:hypothetical protein